MVKELVLQYPVLIADIGGTNFRGQIILDNNKDPPDAAGDVVEFKHKKYPSLEEAIEKEFLAKNRVKEIKSAILAVAGPVTDKGVEMTNCKWTIEPKGFFEKLACFEVLVLLNDFEALAMALPFLDDTKDCVKLGHQHNAGKLDAKKNTSKVVLGPGTGLGAAMLDSVVVENSIKWRPVASEAGHTDIGAAHNERETKIWQIFRDYKRWKMRGDRLSAEDFVSGPGLEHLYRSCCIADEVGMTLTDSRDISEAALKKTNKQAEEAMDLFAICLGRFAGDLALAFKAEGGCYIAGGIVEDSRIQEFLNEKSLFRNSFEDKAPKQELLKGIGTAIVKHKQPALLGLTKFVESPNDFIIDLKHWTRSR